MKKNIYPHFVLLKTDVLFTRLSISVKWNQTSFFTEIMMYNYSIFLTLSFILFISCCRDDSLGLMQSNRTVIIYMAADNDLFDDALANLKEIENAFTEKGTNLIVFIDPADDAPKILQIVQRGAKRIKTYPEFNSADAEQMCMVLKDIIRMYPASGYGLILWSHGTSWMPAGVQLRSFGEDNACQMDICEMASALPVRFDFILMDACLMGAVEVAYELRNKTDFIIASPTETMYTGFPYGQIIPELIQPDPDLKKVAEKYYYYYNDLPFALRSASISLIKTGELENLAALTNQLIKIGSFDAELFDRTSVQRLDVYHEQYTFDYIDFIEKAFPDADTGPLKAQLDITVLFKAHTPEFLGKYAITNFCGLSCYIPNHNDENLNEFYRQLDWCRDSGFYRLFQ